MDYRLSYRAGGAENRIVNPSPEQIEDAIDVMIPVKNYYLILAEESCAKCGHGWASCVQMVIDTNDSPTHTFHIEFQESPLNELSQCDHSRENKKQYKFITANEDEVKRIFRMFALGVNPDISDWEDITEKIFNKK